MIQRISHLHQSLSTKTKTIVLVLGVFLLLSFVFVTLRYFDTKTFIKESQTFYAQRVKSVYNASITQTAIFYTNRGYANLNSFGIIQALNNHDVQTLTSLSQNRWKVLQQENGYLRNLSFYDEKGKLLCFLGEPPALTNLPLKVLAQEIKSGFWFSQKLSYKIFIPSKEKGYLVFTLDPKYFLSQIQELTGFQGFMSFGKNQVIHLFIPDTASEYTFISYLQSPTHNLQKNKMLIAQNELYTIHSIDEKAYGNEQTFQTLFFQNITKGQQRLYDAIYESAFIVLFLCAIAMIILNYGFDVLINRIEETNKKLLIQEEKLKHLNTNLEARVEEETKKEWQMKKLLKKKKKCSYIKAN